MTAIVVVTTVGNEEQANLIGEELVRRRLACCVNLVPIHRSIYRWQGKICKDSEYLLIIKSLEQEYPRLEAAIRELHEYEVPEILAFPVGRGDERFLRWIAECCDKDAAFADEDDVEDLAPTPDHTA